MRVCFNAYILQILSCKLLTHRARWPGRELLLHKLVYPLSAIIFCPQMVRQSTRQQCLKW